MSNYTVKTFARHDDGDGNITYNQLRVEYHGRNRDFSLKLAESMAVHDGALHGFVSVADGFAVVVYENGKPLMNFEHDGIRLGSWYGDEIAEQLSE